MVGGTGTLLVSWVRVAEEPVFSLHTARRVQKEHSPFRAGRESVVVGYGTVLLSAMVKLSKEIAVCASMPSCTAWCPSLSAASRPRMPVNGVLQDTGCEKTMKDMNEPMRARAMHMMVINTWLNPNTEQKIALHLNPSFVKLCADTIVRMMD